MPTSTGELSSFVTSLQSAYNGSSVTGNPMIAQILAATGTTAITNLGTNLIANSGKGGGGGAPVVVNSYTCATQPSYSNATFSGGTATSANQAWQKTNASNPCYYACTG
jgi:hypothetical protein